MGHSRSDAAPSVDEVPPRAKSLPLAPPTVLPDFVPARMINEVLYCERLMYLEWVQAEWADNRYTVDGRAVHRKVDERDQLLRSSSREEGESSDKPYTARSVWLSSEKLGITAKVDVVEVDGASVVPIEYKRGREPEGGAYLPERAQVAAQVMLLREHGYSCDGGELYFAEERRRVSVPLTAELERIVRDAVTRARSLAAVGRCPPPLEDSPKCRGCSLAGICLPDEVQTLREDPEEADAEPNPFDVGDDPWGLAGPAPDAAFETPVRRLFPSKSERVPLYVRGRGSQVRLSGERLIVTAFDEKPTPVRIGNTSSVTLFGDVQISTQTLRKLMQDGIPVLFASSGGWIEGRALGADTKNVELRAAQYRRVTSSEDCLSLAKSFVKAKILNSRTLLRRNHRESPEVALSELKQLSRKAENAETLESLLGIEGAAARTYFREFSGTLKPELAIGFEFERRNRRPPTDRTNALLSFCYSLLVREITIAVHAAGLDPLFGFYHQPRFGRASLVLDLMEEFRPILADSTVITAVNNGVVGIDDFVVGNGAVALKPPARKRMILAMERRLDQLVTHPVFDYRLSYRRVLEVQARLLARYLLDEIEHYPGFRVR